MLKAHLDGGWDVPYLSAHLDGGWDVPHLSAHLDGGWDVPHLPVTSTEAGSYPTYRLMVGRKTSAISADVYL